MARVKSSGTQVMRISGFLGLNENPDGDTGLKTGEAAEMSNFKITDEGSLQVRGGTKSVAGLLENGDYSIVSSAASEVLFSDINSPTRTFTAYPAIEVSDDGTLSISGSSVTVNYDNRTDYRFYYYRSSEGAIYKFDAVSYTAASVGTRVQGGTVSQDSEELFILEHNVGILNAIYCYDSIAVENGAVTVQGEGTVRYSAYGEISPFGKYYSHPQYGVCKITRYDEPQHKWYGNRMMVVQNDTYAWKFWRMSLGTTYEHPAVHGIWSGRVGDTEYLVAACGGHLWSLTETDGVWSKACIGSIDSTERVGFFAFNSKLYILTGSNYYVWDGILPAGGASSLAPVSGYAPVVAISTPYSGGGVPLERANRLTGAKRQRFSPDGTHDTFQLAEKNISGVDSVMLNGTSIPEGTSWQGHPYYSATKTNGTVRVIVGATVEGEYITEHPPQYGVNTLEIKWTKGCGNRGSVTGMKYSELFSGRTDNRVFLYGDGSNKAIYSGIDESGMPDAEYFPENCEIAAGESNTPITGLIRHYDRLLAFKEDSAYSISCDTLTLEDGTTEAAFYVTPVNRAIGNCAPGQAMLVENHPRTLDGRSIYEWISMGGEITNDQRNAKRISQRVETSLRSFDLKSAQAYFDKINHEYYILQGGRALVHNTENNTWYLYRDFPASCMIVYKDEAYIGTFDGYIRHFSRDYLTDNGEPIAAYWESGSMDFGSEFKTKRSPHLWVSAKPESRSSVNVTVLTDAKRERLGEGVVECGTESLSNGLFNFFELDFSGFSFGTGRITQPRRLKIGAKDFCRYKIVFTSRPNCTATITDAGIEFSVTGTV